MPRISRETFNSGFFHIMIQGINKEFIFKEKDDKDKYLNLMKKYYPNFQLKVIAYCIMDNHIHFIIYTEDIMQISSYMHKINSIYAMNYNKNLQRVGYVFRGRYKSQYIYNKEYLHKCIKYIHMNPVKANIVSNENEYKYSSYNDFKYKRNFVDEDVIKLVFNEDNYIQIFNNLEDVDIEIMDIDRDEENFEIAIKNYLKMKNTTIDEIKIEGEKLYYFIDYLINKGYKQKQIANKIKINACKICRIIQTHSK